MGIKRVFRLMLVAELTLLVLTVVAWWLLKWTLPSDLQAYQDRWLQSSNTGGDAVAGLSLLVYLCGWVGVLRLRPVGRTLYLAGHVLMLLVTPFTGPTVLNAWASFCAGVSGLCGGMALAMAYFSEIRQDFAPAGSPEHPAAA